MSATKLSHNITPTSFTVSPFKPPKAGQPFVFELNVVATPLDGMKKIAHVQPNAPSWSNFEIKCDEGVAIGGENDAPSPLSYFTSGIAFCLLTHLEEFIKTRKISVSRLQVELKMGFSTMLAIDPLAAEQEGKSTGLTVNIIIDSDEDESVIASLVAVTRQSCMALQSIIQPVSESVHCIFNGEQQS